MYELPFEDGLRFPIPKLVCEMLNHFEVAPNQLMLNIWRLLMSLECLGLKYDVEVGLGEVMFVYYQKEHDNEKGRYHLTLRCEWSHLVTCLKDRGWKSGYFYAKGNLLFGSSDVGDAPSHWRAMNKYLCF